MDGQRRPQRKLPPEVYWRRRIVALVALLMIIAIVWLVVTALTSRGDDASAAPSATPSPEVAASGEPSTEPSAEDASDPEASTSPDADSSAQAATIADCDADDIRVAVAAIPAVAADTVTFDAAVTNTGDEPCLLVGDGEDTTLVVSSGPTRVWGSADCDGTATVVGKRWVLDSGASETFTVAWPRTWSFEGCRTLEDIPQPGSYVAELAVQGIAAEAVPFTI